MKIQENNSGKIIDRNWLLKRKRKRVSCNSDVSTGEKGTPPESSRSPASTKKRRKDEMQFSQAEPKLRGHDGHYFECVACELGGNLLCCDSCPRTYHLTCLNPPLKRTPPGKWKCPTCLEQRDSLDPLRHPKVIFKRARTKSASTKARSDLKLQSFGKMLLSDPSTVSEDIGSFKKGKSTATASEKKSGSFQTDNTCSTSSDYSSGNGTPVNTKSMGKHNALHEASSTSGRKIRSSIKVSNSCSSSKTPKVKPNLSDSSQMEPTGLVCKPANRSKIKTKKITEKEDDIKLSCCITEEARRKKKKQRGKSITMMFKTTFKKKTLSPGVTGSHKKHNQSRQQISSLVNHDSSEHKLTEGIEVGDLLKFGNEVLQVDRILGCRVKGNDLRSGCILTKNSSLLIDAGKSSTNIANRLQSADETILEREEEQLHVREDDDNLREGKDAITALVEEGNDVNSKSIRETTDTCTTILDENNIDENDQKTSFKEEKHASLDEHQALNSSIPGEQDAPHEYERGINEKKLSDVNIDPQLDAFYSGDHNVAEPNSVNSGKAKDIIQTASEENLAQKSVELSGSDVTYEFLVKWVGKSVIHTTWLPESQVKLLAKRKLENYKAKYGTVVINICQEQWGRPQRVIALRGTNDSNREALVKWCGLPYDECTWERLDEPIIQKCAHLISQFSEFESKTLIKDTEGNLPKVKGEAPEVVPLLKQPQELKGGSLFPHQLEALNWLRKCWHKSKNVILADEMGLGKTISACAFLSSVYHEFRAKLPSLVLVPLSTMPNWFAEFSLWAPHLNVVEYHGGTKARSVIRQYEWHASDPDRIHKLSKSYKFNVLLTTYEMILTDYSHLRGVPWEVLVVDEGHRLKNSGSKLFSMLNTFSFEHRILLTGTPLQNNIGEMYNLLNFLQPVSFPSLSAFEEKFNDLTTAEKVEELKKLVAPHMLRRLKKDAMQNIPPKTERMVPVELTSIQAEYYRAMLTKNYQILRNLGRGGVQSMLNIVMQLRKVCNHPYLIPGTEPESGSVEFLHEMRIKASAKLTLLHSMLKILHREGHRVLIFSQMTKLLDILEDYVTIEFGPKTFERVDGSVSVSDRQAAIARFNQDKTRFIFLLSTRSCGLGINLATADTVVIYDSDFNPHADIQAMNRAHRIGQSNRLLVYRLVVRASVEERILQLARKKLMLDQLFVNKSGSQKEVEDILRWGTEELFSDCDGAVLKDHNETCYNKLEAPVDGEQRHRRRVGGLGDVYQDRCTDGSTKVLWDENAILKLLDRSNLQFGSSDNVDADLDNDMLGSLKEWNDEPAEEQVGTELLPDDGVYSEEQAAENKEDNVSNDIEENEWDRLLRIRWEKYQNEEEASLGRGKRLRKAVSYRETFATLQTETLSESGNDEEEQEPEYSPAGRAFKEKYSRLRARQKDRLLQRQTMGESCLTSPLVHEPKGVLQPSTREGLDINDVAEAQKYHITSQDKENINSGQLSHQMGIQTEPSSRAGRFTKQGHKRHQNSPLDFSVKPPDSLPTDIVLPSHQFHGAGSSASLLASNHLPVLGLCAPNASQMDAVKRNLNSSASAALRSSDQNMTSTSIPEFPFPPPCDPGSSADVNVRDREGVGTERLLPEFFSDTSNGYLKNNIPNRYFPFNPHLPISSQDINTLIHINNSKSILHASDEKMGLQDLALDGNKLQRFSIPNMHGPISFSDVFHNLSLDMKTESRRELRQDFLNIPSAPNFRHLNESLKQKEQLKDPPTLLGLGQIEAANLLPNNHKKVLDNIMMRTSAGAHRSMKKKQKIATWSEDELDALWIGVRRHGRGNWDAMLRDSKLKFSRHRTPEDLAARWPQEQQKIMDVSALPVQKPPRATSFPGVSDGMMARALFGSKFVGSGTHAPKFQSHLTDIKLGCGDLKPGMASLELKDHLGSMGGNRPLFPPWLPGTVPSNVTGDFGAGPSDIAAKLGLPFDLPFQQNPSFSSIADSLGLNCFNCPSMMQHEGKKSPIKFPNLLDRSPNFLYESQKNVPNTKLDAGCSQNRRLSSCQPFIKDDAATDCSKMKNLPHWLRDAVTVPAASPPAPCLPPIISAIAHSVSLLYGPSTIPTFSMQGPPPLEPVDPRRSLKRTKKLPRFNQQNTVDIGSSKLLKNTAAHDTSMFPLTPPIDPLCSDTNINLSSLNLNVKCSSPLSLVNHGKKISASPEALDFVASSLAPGPVNLPTPIVQGTGNPDLPALEKSEASESFGMRMLHDSKAVGGKRKASNNSLLGDWEKLTAEKTCTRFGSRGSSDTDLYSASASEVEVVKVSLEETLSDGHQSEQET